MFLGWCSAAVASLCYGVASVLQAAGARSRAGANALLHRAYLAGLTLDGAGFVVSLAALHRLPLFASEAALAASVGVTAVLATAFLGHRPGRVEVGALALLLAGLVALAVSAAGHDPAPLSGAAGAALLGSALATVAGVVALVVSTTRAPAGSPWPFAILAGVAYGGLGIATRVLPAAHPWWTLGARPAFWALAMFGAAGIVAFGYALQRGAVTGVTAVVLAVETLIPAAVGVWALGDRTRGGLEPLAVAGFALAVVCTLVVSRCAGPDAVPNDGPSGAADGPSRSATPPNRPAARRA